MLTATPHCPLAPGAAGDRRPYQDTSGLVHWPALFFYPEASMSSDTLEDFCEKDMFRWVPGLVSVSGVAGWVELLDACVAVVMGCLVHGRHPCHPGWRLRFPFLSCAGAKPNP